MLTERDVTKAKLVSAGGSGDDAYSIEVTITSSAQPKLHAATKRLAKDPKARLAIFLNGELIMAPRVIEPISGPELMIPVAFRMPKHSNSLRSLINRLHQRTRRPRKHLPVTTRVFWGTGKYWKSTEQIMAGKPKPIKFKRYEITFSKNEENSGFIVQLDYETDTHSSDSPPQNNRLTIAPNESPMEMNWFGEGILIQSIYELNGDTLRIAYFGVAENSRPDSFDYVDSGDGKGLGVWSFKRKDDVATSLEATKQATPNLNNDQQPTK